MADRDPWIAHYGFVREAGSDFQVLTGGMTLALDEEGWIGWSICHPRDNFEKKIGVYGKFDEDGKCVTPGALKRLAEKTYREPGYCESCIGAEERSALMQGIAEEILYAKSRVFSRKFFAGCDYIHVVPRSELKAYVIDQSMGCEESMGPFDLFFPLFLKIVFAGILLVCVGSLLLKFKR